MPIPRPPPPRRGAYAWFTPVTTRWTDNDVYGHLNNAYAYVLFDSAVNRLLIERGGLDIRRGATAGWMVSSACDYFAPVAYPDDLEVGLRVEHLGTSSVRYGLALFRAGEDAACAAGAMVHVFVDRASARPVPLPAAIRAALGGLAPPGGAPPAAPR